MDRLKYEHIDWSKCPTTGKITDKEDTNGHKMDTELIEKPCQQFHDG